MKIIICNINPQTNKDKYLTFVINIMLEKDGNTKETLTRLTTCESSRTLFKNNTAVEMMTLQIYYYLE